MITEQLYKGTAIAAGIGLAIALAGVAFLWVDNARLESAVDRVKREKSDLIAKSAEAAASGIQAAKSKGDQRVKALSDVVEAQMGELAQLRKSLGTARSVDLRVREQLAYIAASGGTRSDHPATAAECTSQLDATREARDLLAELRGRVDSRAGELAEWASKLEATATACERSYDSLIDVK